MSIEDLIAITVFRVRHLAHSRRVRDLAQSRHPPACDQASVWLLTAREGSTKRQK
jgi:hypothetical protein